MPPIPSQRADGRVFDWLGADPCGTPYHLHPLNLVWSEAGVEHDLAIYRGVAERLSSDIPYWSAIIRDRNWRCTLVGCVCLLVAQRRGFFQDLRFRFEAGSMVIPQLAVTMALLDPVDARGYFESVRRTPSLGSHPSRRVSAERAMVCMGFLGASEVTLDGWSFADRDYALLADRVVGQHWDFWRQRLSVKL